MVNCFYLKDINYKLLSAVIGSSLAALLAGNTPKVNPIVPEIITVINTVPRPIVAGRGVNKATTLTVESPKHVPVNPPKLDRIKDSIKN